MPVPVPLPIPLPIDHALRHYRRAHNLSQRALAGLLGVSSSLIGRLEKGDLRMPLADLAAILGRLGFAFELLHIDECTPAAAGGGRCATWESDGAVEIVDAAGRAFPAHGRAEYCPDLPTYWGVRHGGWGNAPDRHVWLWHHRDEE